MKKSSKNDRSKARKSTTQVKNPPKPQSVLNVAFDVGSESLDWAMELDGKTVAGHCENRSPDIRNTLTDVSEHARRFGHDQVRVICESTGIYHRRLLQVADQLGMKTNLVHGEAVAKVRTILFADHGKTDRRDPKAALAVAKVGRLVKHRKLEKQYAQLRELHRLVLRCEARVKVAKCELHADLRSLFPDLRLDKSVLYGATGRALIDAFGANPYAIFAAGKEEFSVQMKARSKYVKKATIEKIWNAAAELAEQHTDETAVAIAEIRSDAVRQLYAEITEFKAR